jgi:hypothetical protein
VELFTESTRFRARVTDEKSYSCNIFRSFARVKNNLYIDGVHYLTAREAGDVLGYAPDYVSRLCREGKLRGRRAGKTWIVEADSLVPFIKAHEARKEAWHQNLSRELKSVAVPIIVRDEDFQPLSPVNVAPRQLHILRASEKAHAAREEAQTMMITRITLSSVFAVLLLFVASATPLSTPIANVLRNTADAHVAAASFFSPIESIARASYESITSIACTITGWCDDVQPMPVVYVRAPQQPIAQAPAPTQITNNITNYIQPTVGSGSVLASGVSEQLLESRLNAMENYLTGRIELAEFRGDRQAESLADSFSDGIGGGGFDDIDITDSSWSGGSISGASISGSTLSGITFSGAQAFDALEVTDATSTNATSTNMYVSGSFGFGTGTGLVHTTDGIASTLANGSNGQVLKMVGGNLAWSTDLTGGGGGGGASFFASTTDDLAIYPADPTDVVIIGDSATTTVGNILEIAGNSLFRGAMTSYNNVTTPRFTATSSVASVFPYASTTALSTNSLCIAGDCRQAWPTDSAFSTTSADYWQTQRSFFSTTSSDYWKSANNFFSTTSASYFLSQNQGAAFSTTSADYLLSTYNKGFFFSTTSAAYFLTQNGSLGFSTTSNDYWQTQRNFFSTTSVDAWKDQRNFFSTSSVSYFASVGLAFSTTSADAWKNARDFFSTTSALYFLSQNQSAAFSTTSAQYFLSTQGALGFSTTSNDYWASQRNFFSTTSADYYKSVNNFFSTSSADYWQTTKNFFSTTSASYFLSQNQGSAFSTTSANYWESQQTSRTADDLTNNSIEDLQDVAAMTENYGDLLYWNGSAWADIATSSLGLIDVTFSTTSADYLLSTYNKGFFFSTTSADAWKDQRNFFSTTSTNYFVSSSTTLPKTYSANTFTALQTFSNASSSIFSANTICLSSDCRTSWPTFTDTSFSTSSADYWQTQRNFFSTSSADAWKNTRDFFSTTSASYFLSQNQGNAFSTTSAIYFAHSSTTIAKTYSANTFTALQNFANASSSIFSANTICLSNDCRTSWPTGIAYPFSLSGNATSTLTQFNGGLTAYASSTIGNGSAAGGLTVNGTATTSRLVVSGTGTSTFAGDILMSGSIMPALDNTYSLGSESRMWKDVYIGPGSLYVNGKKVIEDVSNTITISTDNDQNLMSETSGVGNNTMRATGSGNLNLLSGSGNINVTSTSGNINIGTSGSGQLNLGIVASGTWQGMAIADNYLVKSGNWTGTLDGYEAAQLLGSGFSTTSATYFLSQNQGAAFSTSSALYFLSQNGSVGFSTTSADFWKTANDFFSTTSSDYWASQRNFFSTTSVEYWRSTNDFFSTTSADYFLSQNGSLGFSTTSNDYWKSVNNFFSTTSADFHVASFDKGFFFSTTSAEAWKAANSFFSTSSSDYWQTTRNFFSTTSASYFLGQNQGNAFSTTSAQYFIHSSTTIPKTYTANAFTGLQTFANASSTLFSASYASTTALFANTASTSNLTISALQNGLLKVNASGVVSLATAGTDYANFGYLFPGNATSTLLSFDGGLTTSALTLGSLNGPLHANNGVVSATTSIGVLYGGTGLTSAPSYGQLLVGNSSGGYTLTATSSLGISGGGSGGNVPAGTIAAFEDTVCPAGWTEYEPARGRFLRGIDNGAGIDPDGTRAPGNLQGGAAPNITGTLSSGDARPVFISGSGAFSLSGATGATFAVGTGNRQGTANFDASNSSALYGAANEVRPVNVAVLYCEATGSASLENGQIVPGLTGQVPYYAADGTILSATSSLFIAANGNIGIGSTTPWKNFSIDGDAALTGALFDNAASSGASGMVLQSTGNGVQWVATSSLGIAGGGSSFGYLFPANATSTTLTFSGGILSLASTTIGDGTQAGGLTISGGATTTGNLYVASNLGVAGSIEAGSLISAPSAIFSTSVESAIGAFSSLFAGTASTTAASAYDALYVGRTATTTIRGDNATSSFAGALAVSGSVGIGTDTPSGKFSVGSAPGQNAYFFYDNDDVGDTTDGQTLAIYRRAAEADDYIRFNIDQFRNAYIESSVPNFAIDAGSGGTLSLAHNAGGVTMIAHGGNDLYFGSGWMGSGRNPSLYQYGYITEGSGAKYIRTQISDASNRYEITREDANIEGLEIRMPTLITGGNLGIGTSSPYAKLSVVGDIVGARFIATTTTASIFPYASTTALSATALCLTGDSCITSWPGSSFAYPFPSNATSTTLTFSQGLLSLASTTIGNGTQAGGLTISGGATTTGSLYVASNVGIGVASPSGKLEIGGTEGADEARLIFGASDGSNRYTFETDLDSSTSNDFLGLRTASTDNAFVVRGNGNVGISTSTPGSLFSIGNTNGINFSTATSTFSSTGGINITSGCYAVGGVCLSGADGAFSTTSAQYFVHSSTTIPKLYSSNTWTGNNIFNGTFTLGSLNGPLQANNGVVSATSSIGVLYGGTGLTTAPNYGEVLLGNGSGGYMLLATSSLGITGGSTGDQIAIIIDEKTDGTSGGTFTSGAWRTRDLNTKLHDDIGITLSSNEFTLPAGTYEVRINAPAYRVDYHQARLYNVSDAVVALTGTSEIANDSSNTPTHSFITGTFTIASSKTFRVEHDADTTNATSGFGIASSATGVPEVYTQVHIRKLNGSATVPTFTGASASTAGTAGLVPQPQSGEQGSVLLGNGNWLASTTLFISPAGNVGFGTTSPFSLLSLDNSAPIFLMRDSDTGATARISADSGLGHLNIAADHFGNVATEAINFQTGATNRMTIDASGNVGIGTASPGQRLEVTGGIFATSHIFAGSDASTNPASGNTVGVVMRSEGYLIANASNNASGFFGRTNDGNVLQFYSAGTQEGNISVSGTTVSYNAFTGSHYGTTEEDIERGMLVELDGTQTFKHGTSDSEPTYGIRKTAAANSPAVFGSMLSLMEPLQPHDPIENPYLVMAVGNGDMWVVQGEEESIEPGDYLISSHLAGHAMKDPGTYMTSHIVARAAQKVDWSEVEEAGGMKRMKISVTFEQFDRNATLSDVFAAMLATSTASSTGANEIQQFASSFLSTIFQQFAGFLADASNGIAEIFAKTLRAENVYADTVTTNKLCIEDLCVTKAQLQQMLQGANVTPSSNDDSAATSTDPAPESSDPPAEPVENLSEEPASSLGAPPDAPSEASEPLDPIPDEEPSAGAPDTAESPEEASPEQSEMTPDTDSPSDA